MTVVTTLDIESLTSAEYRSVLDRMGVETKPSPGIYVHVATPTKSGMRIVEVWDEEPNFREFVKDRLGPASEALGIRHETTVTVQPLHNYFAPRLRELTGLVKRQPPAVVSTMDVTGLTAVEFRKLLNEMGVEDRPEPGIYVHLTCPMSFGFRIMEIWDDEAGFQRFLANRLKPATQKLGIDRKTDITFTPVHNLFAPRLAELPTLKSA